MRATEQRSKPAKTLVLSPAPDQETLTALLEQRAEIMTQVDALKFRLAEAVVQLDHVEATVRLFDPEIDFSKLGARKVLPVHHAQHGEVTRIFLAALVDAGRPLSTGTLVERIIQVRGLDRTDSAVRKAVARRLGPSLRYTERKRGLIRSLPGPGQMLMWELVR